jgi:ParB family chromosome partitioning protein
MAKRRKLEAPSAEDLSRLEADFQRDRPRGPLSAPIAQVAAETAGMHDPRSEEDRIAAARDQADGAKFRAASERGLLMADLPLGDIAPDAMVRDRMTTDPQEFEELKQSIRSSGLRLPIEVYDMGQGASPRYGLLSGYRRYQAVADLAARTGEATYATIRAIVRPAQEMGPAFAQMVEENEVRANLSHFERGRIAVLAVQQGAFPDTDASVAALFPVASKAKRSKIRSFAVIFEELGDMLTFPDQLKEKDGLALAAALRAGQGRGLRDLLAKNAPASAEEEAALLRRGLAGLGKPDRDRARGGRPKKSVETLPPHPLPGGGRLEAVRDGTSGWAFRLTGTDIDTAAARRAMEALAQFLTDAGGADDTAR